MGDLVVGWHIGRGCMTVIIAVCGGILEAVVLCWAGEGISCMGCRFSRRRRLGVFQCVYVARLGLAW